VGRTCWFEPENSASYKPLVVEKCLSLRHEVILALNLVSATAELSRPLFKTLFGFIHHITFVHVENDEFGGRFGSIAAAPALVKRSTSGEGDAAISDNSTTLLGGNPQEAFMTTAAHL